MTPFFLGILVPLVVFGAITLFSVQAEKQVAGAEAIPLPQSVQTFLPASSAIIQQVAYGLVVILGFFLTIPIDLRFLDKTSGSSINLDLALPLWFFGMFLFCFAVVGFVSGLKKFINSSAAPAIEMNTNELIVKGHHFLWTEISNLTSHVFSGGRGGSYAYLVLSFTAETSFRSVDLTGSGFSSWFLKWHTKAVLQKIFGLQAGHFVLVPLYGLNRPQTYLRILAKRYWCQATNHPYPAESIEALCPQKSEKDFQSR